MYRYILFLLIFVLFGCPNQPDPPSDPVDPGENKPQFAWNPKQLFPDIDLPEVVPSPVAEIESIPEDAIAIGKDNIGDGSILNNLAFNYIVVENGDYSDLGRIILTTSGTRDEKRVIYCPDGDCVFDGFEIREADHWIISNLTFYSNFREKDGVTYGNVTKLWKSDFNLFHQCHWRNSASGLRIYGNYNTVQFCSFSERPDLPYDIAGVVINARDGEESRGNRIIFNEFKGMTDGAGAPWDPNGDGGSTPATVMAYNTSWLPEESRKKMLVVDENGKEHLWDWSCAENGYDIKNGAITDLPEDQSIFIGNVSIGHRVTDPDCGGSAGSSGAGWVFHRMARNWLIKGNLSLNDAHGCFVKGDPGKPDSKDHVTNIQMQQNAFIQLEGYFPGGIAGWRENPNERLGIRVHCPTCFVNQNIVSGAQYEVYLNNVEAKFENNIYVDIERPVIEDQIIEETKEASIQLLQSPLLDLSDTLRVSFRVPANWN